jgi:hypothetical protein
MIWGLAQAVNQLSINTRIQGRISNNLLEKWHIHAA